MLPFGRIDVISIDVISNCVLNTIIAIIRFIIIIWVIDIFNFISCNIIVDVAFVLE